MTRLNTMFLLAAAIAACACGAESVPSDEVTPHSDGADVAIADMNTTDAAPSDATAPDDSADGLLSGCGLTGLPDTSVRCSPIGAAAGSATLARGDATGLVVVYGPSAGQQAWSAQRFDDRGEPIGTLYSPVGNRHLTQVTRCGAALCAIEFREEATAYRFGYVRLTLDGAGQLVGAPSPDIAALEGATDGNLALMDADPPRAVRWSESKGSAEVCTYDNAVPCESVGPWPTCPTGQRRALTAFLRFGEVDYVSGSCDDCLDWCGVFAGFVSPASPRADAFSLAPSEWPGVARPQLVASNTVLWAVGTSFPGGSSDEGPIMESLSARGFIGQDQPLVRWDGPAVDSYGDLAFAAAANDAGLAVFGPNPAESESLPDVALTFITNAGDISATRFRLMAPNVAVDATHAGLVAVEDGFVAILGASWGTALVRFDAAGATAAW